MGEYKFKVEDFFPKKLFEEVTELRIKHAGSGWVKKLATSRERRIVLAPDDKLTILAADHPARMVTSVLGDKTLLGNRYEYLGRILRVLSLPSWDGVMGTTDVIEELLMLDYLIKEKGGKSFLDGRLIFGCMNRGGLKGASFEMDDRFTSFTAERVHDMKLDGAKLMFRLTTDGEEGCGRTIAYCAKAINELNKYNIPVFLECLPVAPGTYKTLKEAERLIEVIGVATALGDSSRNMWLKIPYCEGFEKVALATTCPILILGGEAKGDPTPLLKEFISGLKAGKNIRGALVGRNILFPGDDDPRAVAGAVYGIVHNGYSLPTALKYAEIQRGREMPILKMGRRVK